MQTFRRALGWTLGPLVLSMAPTLAQAQAQGATATTATGPYAEVGYLAATYKEPGLKLSPAALRIMGGVDLHPNYGVEGLLGFNVKAGTGTSGGSQVEVKLTTLAGVYGKAKLDLSPDVELIARGGYAWVNRGSKVGATTSSDAGGSLSYGAGINYRLSKTTTLGVDYMSYYNRSDISITGFTVSAGMRF